MIEMTVGTKLGVRLLSLLEKCLHLSEVAQKPLVFSGGNHTAIDPAELPTFLPCVKGFGAGIVFDLFLLFWTTGVRIFHLTHLPRVENNFNEI